MSSPQQLTSNAHKPNPISLLVYGALKATMGLRLSQEEEYDGADLSIHKISATPEREANW